MERQASQGCMRELCRLSDMEAHLSGDRNAQETPFSVPALCSHCLEQL